MIADPGRYRNGTYLEEIPGAYGGFVTGDEKEYYGSLLMASPDGTPPEKTLPRDEHGWPYQVILLLHPGGHGNKGLKSDEEGRVLGWVMNEHGRPEVGEIGPLMRPVPSEVADAARDWWEDYQRDPKRFR